MGEQPLIERARLTEEEIFIATGYLPPGWLGDHTGFITHEDRDTEAERAIADAATAKALWAVVEWLRDESVSEMMGYPEIIDARQLLVDTLNQAGIERPKGAMEMTGDAHA